jgi:cation diffusion facilitator CzcD-associated flavoprotein CzcO
MASAIEHVDVVIVGAGLSGIGAAYRLQTMRPGTSYAILEARDALGGTWDLFRYPGVRSDSDMFTLGYAFRPWTGGKVLADGPAILDYVRQTAEEFGIRAHIRFRSSVVTADFDTDAARWALVVEDVRTGDRRRMTCGFLYSCAGYYDYEHPHAPEFPGAATFRGPVVHPQFWPEDLDYAGRRVVVIGSGATAVTLVPALLAGETRAESVTMLQRSPTWVSAVPSVDRLAARLQTTLPARLAHRIIRARNVALMLAFYQFCRRWPGLARRLLTLRSAALVGDRQTVADHFTPAYDPWDQRLCLAPSGDLFRVIGSGQATVVTDGVERFVPEGVLLRSGRVVEADVIVTATGLRLLAFGGIRLSVDGAPVPLPEQYVWNGAMLTGVPNFAFCLGYTNASWTLRADLTHRLVGRVLAWMAGHGYSAVVPRSPDGLTARPLLDLTSGYVQRSISAFPRQGDRTPWRVRQNFVLDSITTRRTRLDRTLRPVHPGERVGMSSHS